MLLVDTSESRRSDRTDTFARCVDTMIFWRLHTVGTHAYNPAHECIKDKVPSVVIHGAKNICGMNETDRLDITSGDKPINMPIITFVQTDTE